MHAVDPIRIRDLLGHIADAQRYLRQLGQMSEQAFLADFRNTESAKYLFIVATEAAIDLCNHIVSHQGSRSPKDYADCFVVLADITVITPELSTRLQRMARVRNLLVHVYAQVDNQRVYQLLQTDLGNLDTFRMQISTWPGQTG
jgi:uncharacterized protein YutE (UPF0331/DUF86 family)